VDEDRFWELIEGSRKVSNQCESQAEALTQLLEELELEEIIEFDRQLTMQLVKAYRWDLWGAAYLINGGCSDDGFEYFRCWLILQGRNYFESVLKDPDRAGDRVRDEDAGEVDCEALLHAPYDVYERKAGHEMPSDGLMDPDEPEGARWEDGDLKRLLPKLWARFR
jgi:hypothetical protein